MSVSKGMYESNKKEKKLADEKKAYQQRRREELIRKYKEICLSDICTKRGDNK